MKYYNITETANILSVNRTTIYNWAKEGKIHICYINGLPRVSDEEIRRLVKENPNG